MYFLQIYDNMSISEDSCYFTIKQKKIKYPQTKDITQQTPVNLRGAPTGSQHVVFHSIKNLLDLYSRDASFPHDGDSSCENSKTKGVGEIVLSKKREKKNKNCRCVFLPPSSIFRQLTTVEATTSFEYPSLRTPWILCPSRLWAKRKRRGGGRVSTNVL